MLASEKHGAVDPTGNAHAGQSVVSAYGRKFRENSFDARQYCEASLLTPKKWRAFSLLARVNVGRCKHIGIVSFLTLLTGFYLSHNVNYVNFKKSRSKRGLEAGSTRPANVSSLDWRMTGTALVSTANVNTFSARRLGRDRQVSAPGDNTLRFKSRKRSRVSESDPVRYDFGLWT